MRPAPRCQARDIGGSLAGVEAAAHEAGSRALETSEDAEREALRKAASEAIQQGELARCVLLLPRCVCVGSSCTTRTSLGNACIVDLAAVALTRASVRWLADLPWRRQ